jgi:hypothetical protein
MGSLGLSSLFHLPIDRTSKGLNQTNLTRKDYQNFTGNPPSASIVVNRLLLSMSQNLIMKSSPAAKNRFLVVSNFTTPPERFARPL